MTYKIISAGKSVGSFNGTLRSDSRGEFVEAPLDFCDIALPGTQLMSETGEYFMIRFSGTAVIDGTRRLLLYLQ